MGALDATLRRAGTAAKLAAQRGAVRALAMTGDPVARIATLPPDGDVYAVYEQLRAQGPVASSRLGALAVTSHELCDQVVRSPAFSVQSRTATPDDDGTAAVGLGPLAGSFLERDPPDHTRLRRIAAPAFRPRAIRSLAVEVEATLHGILDRLERRERFDLVTEVAAAFPVAVIARLMGVPLDDPARFAHLGHVVGEALDGVVSLRQADELGRASAELAELFTGLAEQRPGQYVAFDLRFLFPQDCLGASPARRRLCWLVLIMAVRGFARTDSGSAAGSRKAGCGCACVPGNSWQWRILELVFSWSRLLLPVIPRSRLHLQLCHDLPGRNRSLLSPGGPPRWDMTSATSAQTGGGSGRKLAAHQV